MLNLMIAVSLKSPLDSSAVTFFSRAELLGLMEMLTCFFFFPVGQQTINCEVVMGESVCIVQAQCFGKVSPSLFIILLV